MRQHCELSQRTVESESELKSVQVINTKRAAGNALFSFRRTDAGLIAGNAAAPGSIKSIRTDRVIFVRPNYDWCYTRNYTINSSTELSRGSTRRAVHEYL